jgi:hypothetical protein
MSNECNVNEGQQRNSAMQESDSGVRDSGVRRGLGKMKQRSSASAPMSPMSPITWQAKKNGRYETRWLILGMVDPV